jgi:hypothetical protein
MSRPKVILITTKPRTEPARAEGQSRKEERFLPAVPLQHWEAMAQSQRLRSGRILEYETERARGMQRFAAEWVKCVCIDPEIMAGTQSLTCAD